MNTTYRMRKAPLTARAKLNITRPFTSLWFAAALLDCSKYQLIEYIENGDIPLAFDIAVPGAHRACLRVATAELLQLSVGRTPNGDLARLFDLVLPKNRPVYRPAQLAWLLHCDYDHIYHLLRANILADAGGRTRYQVPRDSIIAFLTERRVV